MEDSINAPAFVRRNKSKTTRARPLSPSNDTASTNDEPEASPSTLAAKLKTKHKARAKTKTRLSFGADDEVCCQTSQADRQLMLIRGKEGEGDVFQVKKSNWSRQLTLGSHPASPR